MSDAILDRKAKRREQQQARRWAKMNEIANLKDDLTTTRTELATAGEALDKYEIPSRNIDGLPIESLTDKIKYVIWKKNDLIKQVKNLEDAHKDADYKRRQYRELIEDRNQAAEQMRGEQPERGYWSWQPDGCNHLETLSCAVLIPAEWLRNLLEEAKQEVRDTGLAQVTRGRDEARRFADKSNANALHNQALMFEAHAQLASMREAVEKESADWACDKECLGDEYDCPSVGDACHALVKLLKDTPAPISVYAAAVKVASLADRLVTNLKPCEKYIDQYDTNRAETGDLIEAVYVYRKAKEAGM